MPTEVALRFECGGAALTGGGDGLAVVVVGDIAGGEEPRGLGGGAAWGLDDVTVFVFIDEVAEEGAVGDMANGDEHAGNGEFGFFSADEVLQNHRAHLAFFVGEVFAYGRVPDRFDFWVRENAVGHDF